MLKAETSLTRAPRGTKPVSQAFFAALETIPEASRAAVAKAAQAMIRDELKSRREKLKATAAKEKARKKAIPPVESSPKLAPRGKAAGKPLLNGADAPKRRGRKPAAETLEE